MCFYLTNKYHYLFVTSRWLIMWTNSTLHWRKNHYHLFIFPSPADGWLCVFCGLNITIFPSPAYGWLCGQERTGLEGLADVWRSDQRFDREVGLESSSSFIWFDQIQMCKFFEQIQMCTFFHQIQMCTFFGANPNVHIFWTNPNLDNFLMKSKYAHF